MLNAILNRSMQDKTTLNIFDNFFSTLDFGILDKSNVYPSTDEDSMHFLMHLVSSSSLIIHAFKALRREKTVV